MLELAKREKFLRPSASASRTCKKIFIVLQFDRQDETIPHQVTGVFGAAKVILKPAAPGTGLIAGWTGQSGFGMCGSEGYRLSKRVGSRNPHNAESGNSGGFISIVGSSGQRSFRNNQKLKNQQEVEK